MAGAPAECTAIDETVVFLSHFKDLEDPRQRGKVSYPLEEILLLCLLAVLAGAQTITDIALFGSKKLAVLRRFRPLARRRMIISVTYWRCWIPSSSSGASSLGLRL
jgi:hypothetical protein